MADLPEWVKAHLLASTLKYDEPSSEAIRLRGSFPSARAGVCDLSIALANGPPGYCLANIKGKVEHSRGDRFTWQVIWITNVEAERRYQDKQAARLSRYEVQG